MALFSKKSAKPTDRPATAPKAAAGAPAADLAALASRNALLSLGEIVSLMMRTPYFRTLPLAQVQALVVPAVSCGQVMVARVKNEVGAQTPVAACLWARVSPDIDKKLTANLDKTALLSPAAWRSGDIAWVMAAFGDRRAIVPLVQRLQKVTLKGGPLKVRTFDAKGVARLETLGDVAPAKRG